MDFSKAQEQEGEPGKLEQRHWKVDGHDDHSLYESWQRQKQIEKDWKDLKVPKRSPGYEIQEEEEEEYKDLTQHINIMR